MNRGTSERHETLALLTVFKEANPILLDIILFQHYLEIYVEKM